MTTELLAAVLAAPDDSEPRRAFAAAVRTSDPDRAELIDRQLELRERCRRGENLPSALSVAARNLVKLNGRRWAGPLAARVDDFYFWGGFIEEIKLDASKLLVSAGQLVTLAPIRHLSIRAVPRCALISRPSGRR